MTGSDMQDDTSPTVRGNHIAKLNLVVEWPAPENISMMPVAYYAGGKVVIFQCIELLTDKLNEVIGLLTPDLEATPKAVGGAK